MHKTGAGLSLSATDLSNSLACRHLTGLDMSAALEGRERPFRTDPLGDILKARGLAHEKEYVDGLKAQGRDVLDLSARKDPEEAAGATRDAMRAGQDVIVQAALLEDDGRWYGRPDVLLRTDKPGTWPWSYEAVDTSLWPAPRRLPHTNRRTLRDNRTRSDVSRRYSASTRERRR